MLPPRARGTPFLRPGRRVAAGLRVGPRCLARVLARWACSAFRQAPRGAIHCFCAAKCCLLLLPGKKAGCSTRGEPTPPPCVCPFGRVTDPTPATRQRTAQPLACPADPADGARMLRAVSAWAQGVALPRFHSHGSSLDYMASSSPRGGMADAARTVRADGSCGAPCGGSGAGPLCAGGAAAAAAAAGRSARRAAWGGRAAGRAAPGGSGQGRRRRPPRGGARAGLGKRTWGRGGGARGLGCFCALRCGLWCTCGGAPPPLGAYAPPRRAPRSPPRVKRACAAGQSPLVWRAVAPGAAAAPQLRPAAPPRPQSPRASACCCCCCYCSHVAGRRGRGRGRARSARTARDPEGMSSGGARSSARRALAFEGLAFLSFFGQAKTKRRMNQTISRRRRAAPAEGRGGWAVGAQTERGGRRAVRAGAANWVGGRERAPAGRPPGA